MGPELHWFSEDVPATRLAATLVGMANTKGGTVLIGVSPRAGHIQGVHDRKEVTDRIFQAALLSEPPLVLPVPGVEIHSKNGSNEGDRARRVTPRLQPGRSFFRTQW